MRAKNAGSSAACTGRLVFLYPGEQQPGDTIKVHVNFLSDDSEAYLRTREALPNGGEYLFAQSEDGSFIIPEELQAKNLLKCLHRHAAGMCGCMWPLMTWGQDESCYAAYSLPMKAWVFENQAIMRKKTEGQGVMVTLMIGPDGLGIPLTPEQLEQVNEYRQERGRAPLTCSPGMLFFEYGVRREGFWNSEKFCEQMVDCMDCLEVKYPRHQFCFEVDQSSGHTKHRVDGLSIAKDRMGLKWGGKKPTMHATTISDEINYDYSSTVNMTSKRVL